jgi:hypothetical protein
MTGRAVGRRKRTTGYEDKRKMRRMGRRKETRGVLWTSEAELDEKSPHLVR